MLTIADGRKSFYQWDIGQGLTVTPGEGETITEVHIGLNGCKKYFVVEPVDGIVAVYDELLQKGDTFLVAYEYVKTADDVHTINKYVFKITGRPKATDYAYTPTESHSWEWWCNKAKSYAEAAAESANQAETAAVSADASADRAEAKADSIKNMTVSAHAEEGTEPTVTKTEEGGTFNLDFGLVRGETGPRGPQGEPGPKGEDGRVTFEDVEPLLITDTASGAIASFPDGSGLDFISLKANIDPIQDLHGYDHPWVGGAGKNKIPVSCESTVKGGVTYTVYKNSSGAVTRIHAEGTSTAAHSFSVVEGHNASNPFRIKAGSYWFKGLSSGVSGSFDINIRKVGEATDIVQTTNKVPLVLEEDTDFQSCYLYVYNGKTLNLDIYPMIWSQSESSDDFEPYSNICPISGWDSVEAYVSPTELKEDGTTHTATFDETVYGGTVDLVSGVLTVDRAYVDLGTLTWTYQSGQGRFLSSGVSSAIKAPATNGDTINVISSSYKYMSLNSLGLTSNVTGCAISTTRNVYVKDPAYTDATAFKTAMNGVQLVYELATPRTIQLDPQTITTLVGVNNVWADSGDSEVEYYANAKLYIDKKLGELS